MRVFFDSSAFVKRYVSETGTDAVLEWCDRATEIGLSGIALPEIISAFYRLRREGQITDLEYQQLKSLLLSDIEDIAVCDLTPVVLAKAVSCLETNVLRGMDAIHIGFLNELWSHPAEKSPLTPLWQRGEAALAAGGFFPFPQLEPDRYIGSAVALQADVFVSADQRQRDAATRAGLRVEAV